MITRPIVAALVAFSLITLGGCEKKAPEKASDVPAPQKAEAPPPVQAVATAPEAAAQPNPERNAYFGETHIHTSWSVDA